MLTEYKTLKTIATNDFEFDDVIALPNSTIFMVDYGCSITVDEKGVIFEEANSAPIECVYGTDDEFILEHIKLFLA